MADAAYKVGDVVVLKSGGPLMTVSAVERGYVYTVWFTKESQEEKSTKLKEETVRRVENIA